MWCRNRQIKSRYSSRLLRSSFIIVLMMLPMSAHGELEFNAAGSTTFGDNRVNIDIDDTWHWGTTDIGSVDGELQDMGFGLGMMSWPPLLRVLGAGIDFSYSKVECGNTTMDLLTLNTCLLMRIQFGQNSAFPHGRIVPYVGMGLALHILSGPVSLVSDDFHEDVFDLGLGFVGKFGLEWIIFSGLAIFIEGRYLSTSSMEQGELPGNLSNFVHTTLVTTNVSVGQLFIGIAVHS